MNIIIEDKKNTVQFGELDAGALFMFPCNESLYLKLEDLYNNFNAVNLSENRLCWFGSCREAIEYTGTLSVVYHAI